MPGNSAHPAPAFFHAVIDQGTDALARGLLTRVIHTGTRKRSSIRLDAPTWRALHEIAAREHVSLDKLCQALAAVKPEAISLTVAIRVGVLNYYRAAATADGHTAAGHGKILAN